MLLSLQVGQLEVPTSKPSLDDGFCVVFENDMGKSSYMMNKCPSKMSPKDIQKVNELLELKKELCILYMSKIRSLKVDETLTSNKLLGIKFNFDDNQKEMKKTQVEVKEVEQVLAKAQQQGLHFSDVVSHPMSFLLLDCIKLIAQRLCGIRWLLHCGSISN